MDRSVSCHVSEWAGQLLDTSYMDVSRSAVGLSLADLLPKTWVDVTLPGSLRRWCCWWDEGQTGSLPSSQEDGTMWGSVFGTMIGKSIGWAGTCLLKLALPGLGLHWDFVASYLYSQIPISTLFPVSVCWMITVASFRHLVNISFKCTIFKCIQPSKSTCSTSADSTNYRSKIFLKIPESSRNQTWICCMLTTIYI